MRPLLLVLALIGCAGGTGGEAPADPGTPAASCTDTWFADVDDDGFGDRESAVVACEAPDLHVADATDCDDADASVHPGAAEVCGGADEDCDGRTDDDDSDVEDPTTWYADQDGDGAGTAAVSVTACDAPEGYVDAAEDCDDLVYVQGGVPSWYEDADGDGHGTELSAVLACEAPEGRVGEGGDCDDADATVHPGATEWCDDGLDTDCDGTEDDGDALDAGTWYPDADADGWGGDASPTQACDLPSGHLEAGGDCDDADAGVHPDAVEVCSNGVDEDCDGGPGPDCGLSGSYTTDEADVTLENAGSGIYLGYAVAGRADGDGDGYDDIAVSDVTAGVVYLLHGPVTSMAVDTSTAAAAWSGSRGSYSGRSLAWVGDTDGDGSPELAIGMNAGDSGGQVGALFLVDGDATGSESLTDVGLRWSGESGTEKTANVLSGAGDVDGDGVDDVLVGSPLGGGNERGRAFLLLGPITSSGDLADADADFTGGSSDDQAGCGVAGAGDWDGDGLADLAVGASGADDGEQNGGTVYVVSGTVRGSTTLSATGVVAAAWGADAYAGVGCALAGGEDLDGDGAMDLAISGEDTARVHILSGPLSGTLDLGRVDAVWTGGTEITSLAIAGDVDGDGWADVLVGDGGYSSDTGIVYLVRGPVADAEASLADADASFLGTAYRGNVGYRVSGAGDVDGDGYDDVLIGAYDADGTWIFHGGGY